MFRIAQRRAPAQADQPAAFEVRRAREGGASALGVHETGRHNNLLLLGNVLPKSMDEQQGQVRVELKEVRFEKEITLRVQAAGRLAFFEGSGTHDSGITDQ